MKKILIILICGLCFGQIEWEIEAFDTVFVSGNDFYFSSMALDTHTMPYVVYNKNDFSSIVCALRTDAGWLKEIVESGLFYYGPSIILDDNNTAHVSYYRRDDAVNKTYVYYAFREYTEWQIEVVDSSDGSFGAYFWNFNSSIGLDTLGQPGIAYIAWHEADSLHYLKYAHFDGFDWDTSIVARDTTWEHRYPLDHSPSLKFDRNSTPHIAFHRVRADTDSDTIFIAYFDDALQSWVISPAICNPHGTYRVSFTLNSQDYPCIAHGYGYSLAYSWWDGVSWYTDYGIASIGVLHVRISLDVDSSDRPHILYMHWGIGSPRYCYKDGYWHLCGPVELDTLLLWNEADISLMLDDNNQPHVSYKFAQYISQDINGIKYAKGKIVGIEERENGIPKSEFKLQIFPNPFYDKIDINWQMKNGGYDDTRHLVRNIPEICIYDVTGSLIKRFDYAMLNKADHIVWNGYDNDRRRVPSGVYFIQLQVRDRFIVRKIIKLK